MTLYKIMFYNTHFSQIYFTVMCLLVDNINLYNLVQNYKNSNLVFKLLPASQK